MTRFISKVITLCCVAVLPAWGVLSAQETETVRMGYCGDKLGGGLISQNNEPAEYHAAIRLPKETLKKYAGAKLNTVEFAITQKAGTMMTVFITKDLKSPNPLRAQTIYQFDEGWNTVKLQNPYTITGNEDLYVGYAFYTNAETINAKVITFEFDNNRRVPGVNFYGQDEFWDETPAAIDFNLSIRAYAEGTGMPRNDVAVAQLSSADIIAQNVPTKATFKIWNYGIDLVENVDIELSTNGKVFDTQHLEGVFVEHNCDLTVDIPSVNFPEEGNNTLEVKVTKVNGTTDTDQSDNQTARQLYAVRQGAKPVARNILFEQFCTENDELLPEADKLYTEGIGSSRDVIWINHHVDDDKFQLTEAAPYSYFFDKGRIFWPAVMVDRNIFEGFEEKGPAYFVAYAETATSLIGGSRNIPAYIAPQVSANYNADNQKLHIVASGKAEVKEMPFETDLRLTTYVVEDRVTSTTQKGQESYTHNGIVRAIACESCWGDALTIDSDYSYQHEYDVDVPADWNVENLRIVSVVSNYHPTDKTQLQVYNATSNTVGNSTAIDQTNANNDQPQIWIVDGHVSVAQGHQLLGVYDLSGKLMAGENLTNGIYIVRTTNGTTTHNTKVVVK